MIFLFQCTLSGVIIDENPFILWILIYMSYVVFMLQIFPWYFEWIET